MFNEDKVCTEMGDKLLLGIRLFRTRLAWEFVRDLGTRDAVTEPEPEPDS